MSASCIPSTDFIMVVFITINLGKCGAGAVRRRSWLGMSGVLIIVFAGVAAYGLNSGFGELISPRPSLPETVHSLQKLSLTGGAITGSVWSR